MAPGQKLAAADVVRLMNKDWTDYEKLAQAVAKEIDTYGK